MKFYTAILFIFLFPQISFSQYSKKYDCYNKGIVLQPDVQAVAPTNIDDYLTNAFSKQLTPGGNINLVVQIDSAGAPCTAFIFRRANTNLDIDQIKTAIDQMPHWVPAVQKGIHVYSRVMMNIIFRNGKAISDIIRPAYGPEADKIYMQAVITMRSGDELPGLAETAGYYEDSVAVKDSRNSDVRFIPVNQIRSIVTAYSHFEHVIYAENGQQNEQLLWLKKHGRIDLFAKDQRVSAEELPELINAGKFPVTSYVQYYLRKDGIMYIPDRINFAEVIRPLFSDAPKLLKKLDAGEYSYDNIEELVKKYNNL